MKQFLYCESTDGGMDTHVFWRPHQLAGALRGWMSDPDCVAKDRVLCEWMERAPVGEMCSHRLGICVRLKDTE
jgi:hypothetical protein